MFLYAQLKNREKYIVYLTRLFIGRLCPKRIKAIYSRKTLLTLT
jgi:hypothetical protein